MHDQRLAYPYNDEDDMAGMLILAVFRMWHNSGHREDEHKARSSRTRQPCTRREAGGSEFQGHPKLALKTGKEKRRS